MFGLVQYFDKKRNQSVCIAALDTFANAVRWGGKIWTIKDTTVTGYEIHGYHFNNIMTPKSLYHALLLSYKDKNKKLAE